VPAPFQGPFSIQVESWFITPVSYLIEREREVEEGRITEKHTVKCSLGAGAEEDGVGWESREAPV